MTKISEFRDLSVEDLRQREHELAEQIFRLRIQKSLGQVEAPAKLKTIRRDLARIKTLIVEKSG